MKQFQEENNEELADLQHQLQEYENAMQQMEQRQNQVRQENERIQKAIENGRHTDQNVNIGATDQIIAKDRQFVVLKNDLQGAAKERL